MMRDISIDEGFPWSSKSKRENETKERLPYSLDEFKHFLNQAEKNLGCSISQIENGNLVRGNNKSASTNYGRVKTDALDAIFTRMINLQPNDVFIDIGHGVGSISLQAAYTKGCEARGIEIHSDRFTISKQLKAELEDLRDLEKQQDLNNDDYRNVGNVKFIEGDFSNKCHEEFITQANKIFVNNAEDIFGARCDQQITLDDHLARLFTKMKAGTIMVTLTQLKSLGRSVKEENEYRERFGLSQSSHASFFECVKHDIGTNAVTWKGKNAYVWVYERNNSPGFLCCGKNCQGNSVCTAINQEDNIECVFCGWQRRSTKRNTYNSSDSKRKSSYVESPKTRNSNRKKSMTNRKTATPTPTRKVEATTTASPLKQSCIPVDTENSNNENSNMLLSVGVKTTSQMETKPNGMKENKQNSKRGRSPKDASVVYTSKSDTHRTDHDSSTNKPESSIGSDAKSPPFRNDHHEKKMNVFNDKESKKFIKGIPGALATKSSTKPYAKKGGKQTTAYPNDDVVVASTKGNLQRMLSDKMYTMPNRLRNEDVVIIDDDDDDDDEIISV